VQLSWLEGLCSCNSKNNLRVLQKPRLACVVLHTTSPLPSWPTSQSTFVSLAMHCRLEVTHSLGRQKQTTKEPFQMQDHVDHPFPPPFLSLSFFSCHCIVCCGFNVFNGVCVATSVSPNLQQHQKHNQSVPLNRFHLATRACNGLTKGEKGVGVWWSHFYKTSSIGNKGNAYLPGLRRVNEVQVSTSTGWDRSRLRRCR